MSRDHPLLMIYLLSCLLSLPHAATDVDVAAGTCPLGCCHMLRHLILIPLKRMEKSDQGRPLPLLRSTLRRDLEDLRVSSLQRERMIHLRMSSSRSVLQDLGGLCWRLLLLVRSFGMSRGMQMSG
ncbi:unnamed protein product, partial [Musa banksii]